MCGHMGDVEMLEGNERGGDGVLHHTTFVKGVGPS